MIVEGPLLDLMMDTDQLKERIINGALADVFKRSPAQIIPVPRSSPPIASEAANDSANDGAAAPDEGVEDTETDAIPAFEVPVDAMPPETPSADSTDLPAKD
jgi:hypothetical protein